MSDSIDGLIAVLGQVGDPLALLAGLFHHSPMGLQVYSADGHSLLTNAAFRHLFGSEPPPEYNVLEDEIARDSGVLDLIRRSFAGETVQLPPIWYDPRALTQVHIPEGNRVAIESTFFPLRDRGGTVSHVVVVFKDVTVERRLRDDAERERDLLTLIIEQSGNGVIVADAEGVLRIFNPEAERQHGVPRRSVTATEWARTYGLLDLDGRTLPLERTPLHRALRGEPVPNARWQVKRPSGEVRVLSGTASPLRAVDGTISGAVLITRDETDQLADERRLRFQATILENVRDSIVVTDFEGRIVEWNPGAEEVFGYTAAEMVGRTPAVLYPEAAAEDLAEQLRAVAAGRDYVGEWRGRRKDGSEVWVDIKTTVMRDASGRPLGFLGVGKDVTDRKRADAERARADEERQRARELAEAASRAKDEFLAMLGHELRNPLAPIVSALELMKLKAGGAPPTREQQVIERQVEHLVRLVDDLLDVARITRGKVELQRAAMNLRDAVGSALEMAAPLVEQRRHHLELALPPEPLRVLGDEARLAQVIANLLTNAARYTEPGGHIRVAASRVAHEVALSVKDDGVGIAPELLPRVFDLFVQGPRAAHRREGGLGIGLTLVQNLVALHGGTVAVSSDGVGRGTEVVMRLPALPDDKEP